MRFLNMDMSGRSGVTTPCAMNRARPCRIEPAFFTAAAIGRMKQTAPGRTLNCGRSIEINMRRVFLPIRRRAHNTRPTVLLLAKNVQ
jgi:hypothetical protein